MTLSPGQALAAIIVMAAVTLITRLLPFALFDRVSPPKAVLYMGKVLPPAIIAMLIVYCLRNIDFFSGNRGAPEIAASVSVVLLHLWRRNNLLSILGGTLIYIALVALTS